MNKIYISVIFFLIIFELNSCSITTTSKNKDNLANIEFIFNNNHFQLDTAELPQKIIPYIVNASVFEQQGNYAQAIIEYQMALKFYKSASLHYLLAKNYYELNYPELAQEHAENAIELNKNFIEPYKLLANIYFDNLKYEEALKIYQYINEIEPNVTNRIYLARLYENKNPDTAITLYRSIAEEQENIFVISRLVRLYEEKNDAENLLYFTKKLFNLIPNSDISNSLIKQLIKKNDFQQVTEIIEIILEKLSPDNAYISFSRTIDFFLDDTTDISKIYIPKLLQLSNRYYFFDWRIAILSGFLAEKIKDTNNVEKFFKRSLNLADSIPDVPLQIALYYFRAENFPKVNQILSTYLPKFPSDFRYYYYYGLSLSFIEELNMAQNVLNKALELKPNDVNTLIQLAIVYDKLGIVDSSDNFYEKVLSIDSLNPLANNNYAYSLCLREQQLDRALQMSKIALKANPESAAYLDTYGWIHFKIGDYITAYEYISKAAEFEGASAEVFEHLGDIYIKMGEPQKALEAWQKALELEPNRETVIMRLKSIK